MIALDTPMAAIYASEVVAGAVVTDGGDLPLKDSPRCTGNEENVLSRTGSFGIWVGFNHVRIIKKWLFYGCKEIDIEVRNINSNPIKKESWRAVMSTCSCKQFAQWSACQ
ncbi:hypothetical protein L1887_34585 [Cichorium endivia]|nr:hypothetical protein L1887_34585 [Cichorium endivia]